METSKPSARKRPIDQQKRLWAVILILLLAGGGAAWYFLGNAARARAQSAPRALAATQTAPVTRGDITLAASGAGTLTVKQAVDLSFSTGGTVTTLNVKLGDAVRAGDVLAGLGNAASLEANLAEKQVALLQAQDALEQLRQKANLALAQAEQDWIDAQAAYAAALAASQRTSGARCSSAVMARDQAALDRASQKLSDLTAKDNGSQAWIDARHDYDTALANATYCSSYSAAEKASAQSKLALAENEKQQAEAKYTTLKAAAGIDPNALALKEAQVTQAETQLAAAAEQLKGITITAPSDGKVVYLAAAKGAIVDTSKFITLADVSQPTLAFSVDETDMSKVAPGSPATVVFDALPESVFSGKVIQVDPQLSATGQYRVVKGVIELDAGAVKAVQNLPLGLNATVNIVSATAKNVLLVPAAALIDQGNQQYAVRVRGADGQMTLQPVEVGLNDGTHAEITRGLMEGDLVSAGISRTNSRSTNAENPFNAGGMPPGGGMLPPDR